MVDALGNLLALHVTPADADERAEVGRLTRAVQAVTDESVKVAIAASPCGNGRRRIM